MTNVYVTLPPDLVAIKKYPGYFFHITEYTFYSIKSGVLRPLPKYKANPWNHQFTNKFGWSASYTAISHQGIKRILVVEDYIQRLAKKGPKTSTIPMETLRDGI